jgi:hypothetical protein
MFSARSDRPYLQTPDFAKILIHEIDEWTREGQTITCAAHLSHHGVVFGLSQGDIVYSRATSAGVYVDTVLKEESVIGSLLSGIIGTTKKPAILTLSGCARFLSSFLLGLGTHIRDSAILVSVSADGILRVWDCLSRTCLQQVSVMSLIDQEIVSNPSQGVVMEGVCLDTSPFDLLVTTSEADPSSVNAHGVTIAIGVTIRVGRDRSWNVSQPVILSKSF